MISSAIAQIGRASYGESLWFDARTVEELSALAQAQAMLSESRALAIRWHADVYERTDDDDYDATAAC